MKVITITLNPSLDKTYLVQGLLPGKLNRVQTVFEDAAGKGINVSKNIQSWGFQSVALGFLGGYVGRRMEELLDQVIQCDMVQVEGITRINIKIKDEITGALTEVNEPGPSVGVEDIEKLVFKLKDAIELNDIVVISGSAPKGVETSLYQRLVDEAKQKGAFVVLDADKGAFIQGVQAIPGMIKPNEVEVQWAMEKQEPCTLEQLIAFGTSKIQTGVEWVVISRGKDGAIFMDKTQTLIGKGLKVEVKSPIGAGDAMVSGMIFGKCSGWDFESTCRFAMAASVATVVTEGTKTADLEIVKQWIEQIHLERWN